MHPQTDLPGENDPKIDAVEEDRRLWTALRGGDEHAFSQLYDRYFGLLFRYGCKLTADRAVVKDCIQDLFVRIWNGTGGQMAPRNVRQYLLVSLRRSILRAVQRNRRRPEEARTVASRESALIEEETRQQQRAMVRKALERLSKREREAIFLRYYAGLSHEEITAVMGLKVNALYNLLSRAVRKLRGWMTVVLVAVGDHLFTWAKSAKYA